MPFYPVTWPLSFMSCKLDRNLPISLPPGCWKSRGWCCGAVATIYDSRMPYQNAGSSPSSPASDPASCWCFPAWESSRKWPQCVDLSYHTTHSNGVPGSYISALGIVAIWGMKEYVENLSLSFPPCHSAFKKQKDIVFKTLLNFLVMEEGLGPEAVASPNVPCPLACFSPKSCLLGMSCSDHKT